jgi:hypothetical protein
MLELALFDLVLEFVKDTPFRSGTWGHKSLRKMRMMNWRTRNHAW